MIFPIVLVSLYIPLALVFILFIILFMTGNLIHLFKSIRKNKKIIEQVLLRLENLQKVKEQIKLQGKGINR